MEELDSTWKETERRIKTDGYREGAAKGREETFQKGFDDGYAEGFIMGESMGHLKALQMYGPLLGQSPLPEELKSLADEPKKGECLTCKAAGSTGKVAMPDSVRETSYEDIKQAQTDHNREKIAVINKFVQRRPEHIL